MALSSREGLEEERRLLYVALTRRAARTARLRPRPLLPPPARHRRRERARQHLPLPDRRGAVALRCRAPAGVAAGARRRADPRAGHRRRRRALALAATASPASLARELGHLQRRARHRPSERQGPGHASRPRRSATCYHVLPDSGRVALRHPWNDTWPQKSWRAGSIRERVCGSSLQIATTRDASRGLSRLTHATPLS